MLKRLIIFYAVLIAPLNAGAGRPLITDDTATQGRGKYQLEVGGEYDRDRETIKGASSTETDHSISTTLTYGIANRVDAIISSSYLRTSVATEGAGTVNVHGISDTTAGIIWKLYDRQGLSLAVKPSVSFPTGNDEKGLGSGKIDYGTYVLASKEFEPWELHLNLGYTRNENDLGERKDLWHASLAAVYEVLKDLKVCADIGADTNRDATSEVEPAYILGGVIYEVRENFDLSFGVKAGLSKPETDWALLPGVTYRF